MGRLDGRTAIVTGAGRGIGREEALLLAAQGAMVTVNDIDADAAAEVVDAITSAGGSAVASADDCSTWAGAEALVGGVIEHHGHLDVLVNNAGILRDAMSFSMTEQQWDDVIRVHLKGHFAPSHFAAAHWRERAKAGEAPVDGRIVNTASEAGLYGLAGQSNYATAKAGIAALTISLARELDKYGVTVNAIAPRARTRMTEPVLGAAGGRGGHLRRVGPGQHRPGGGLAGLRRGRPGDRPGAGGGGRQGPPHGGLEPGRSPRPRGPPLGRRRPRRRGRRAVP